MRPRTNRVGAPCSHPGEALVVAEVEVGLGAVVGDEDLAMLEGRHRAGIDVQVGIEFAEPDRIAAGLQQRPEGGGCQPLAERRDHAAGDENISRHANTPVPDDTPGPLAFALRETPGGNRKMLLHGSQRIPDSGWWGKPAGKADQRFSGSSDGTAGSISSGPGTSFFARWIR